MPTIIDASSLVATRFQLVSDEGPFTAYQAATNTVLAPTYTANTEWIVTRYTVNNWPKTWVVKTDTAYTAWAGATTNTTWAVNNAVFCDWCDGTDAVGYTYTTPRETAIARAATRQPITEERRRRLAEEEARRFALYQEELRRIEAQQAAEKARREIADGKAFGLLLSALTAEQRRDLLTKDYFFVNSQKGNLYRVDRGSHLNVRLIDPQTRKVLGTYCAYTPGCPDGDSMLAQKLMLECMEEQFLKVANYHPHQPTPHQTQTRAQFVQIAQTHAQA